MSKLLRFEEWQEAIQVHQNRLEALTNNWSLAEKGKHPVIDFLFKYYSFRYNKLRQWTPGLGVGLEGPSTEELSETRFSTKGSHISLKDSLLPRGRITALQWTLSLLQQTQKNSVCFNCYGLHEWAMVYKAPEIRHITTPLRLSDEEIAAIVEDKPLNCTHHDALRFYTPEALPLNRHSTTRGTQEDYEQSACLHANMDLYKWAYKIYPWISSELLVDCFELALKCREIDMKASPYDLRHLGYEPIKIETPEGREEYVKQQLRLKLLAEPLREKLIKVYQELLKQTSLKLSDK